jgi:hypothetical protein
MEKMQELRIALALLGFTVVDATWGEVDVFGGVPALYFKGDIEQKSQLQKLVDEYYQQNPEPEHRLKLKIYNTEINSYVGFVLFAGPLDNFESDLDIDASSAVNYAEDLELYRSQFLGLLAYLKSRDDGWRTA